jgi:hypothetical protein
MVFGDVLLDRPGIAQPGMRNARDISYDIGQISIEILDKAGAFGVSHRRNDDLAGG